jgi:ABC-type transport system substrate-binding protein
MRVIRAGAAVAAALTLAATAAACTSSSGSGVGSSSSAAGTPQPGGTVTMQWVGGYPNFIFPLMPATNIDGYNVNLQQPLWPYLVYAGDRGQSVVNPDESLYSSLTWSNNDQTITIVLKPNKHYSGPDKPYLSEMIDSQYTTYDSSFDALRAGDVTVGPIPFDDIKQIPELKAEGYSIQVLPVPAVAGIFPNWYAPHGVGAIFQQLYIRQAIEDLINRPQIVSSIYDGYADPGNGPVSLAQPARVRPQRPGQGRCRDHRVHGAVLLPRAGFLPHQPGSGEPAAEGPAAQQAAPARHR